MRIAWVVVPLLAAAGCQSRQGLGRVPGLVVELYDEGAPAGMMELEIDRDGVLRELEVDILPQDLPAVVRNVALAAHPGSALIGAEREIQAAGGAWEVKLQHEGRGRELVIDEEGTILETETEIDTESAPAEVLATARATVPAAVIYSVELIERRKAQAEYHVKKEFDGASYKLVIAPDGTLVRAVREARAEIEIPLAGELTGRVRRLPRPEATD